MSETVRRLGILAGGGVLPREIADSAARRGIPVSIVAIDGEADADFSGYALTRVNWGQIGTMVRALKDARVTDLVIVGRVHRPELWGLKPDLGFFRYLPKIVKIVAAGGDDGVLRRVVRFFELQGLRVIGPGDAAPELVIGEGPIGSARATAADQADIQKGLRLIHALGAFDIGQCVIVSAGQIVTIEGAEGTDRMIDRAAQNRPERGPLGGVLVKRPKPGQEIRIDMPAIGPATVTKVRDAGLAGIAVEAGKVLVAERAETLSRANGANIFVEGVGDRDASDEPPVRFRPRDFAMPFRQLGRIAAEEHAVHDAIKGLATLSALEPFRCGRGAVVVRNHVLAVESGEGVDATVARASGLRQWASITRRRRGVAALRDIADLTPSVIAAVASAGYAGIAVARTTGEDTLAPRIAEADKEGVFILLRAEGTT
ncbi:LpxI family protein [Hyphomicrobium sp.]|uniref:LpxI family protein n=1 Tax=Hyphomicrobium sp. TaxID=82 RepID=UPI002E35E1D9|nr:UDP-2,3-diacylglucosamine diphosphatase LpxI [Hyphomicrobium sp.]HEX2843010.1 UDP-2,3-diacylglucosamine diphosphatase LpxI [Hyphomicrobium sp.]